MCRDLNFLPPKHSSTTFIISSPIFTLVPTIDTTRTNWILEQMVKINRPVLLVGESGTSKTATIFNFLKNLNADSTVCLLFNIMPLSFIGVMSFDFKFFTFLFLHFQITLTINFSSRTTSMDLQRNLEANVEKRTKEIYGPPVGKRLLVFIDDMNMPKVRAPGA